MLYNIICTSIITNSIKSFDKVKLYIYYRVYYYHHYIYIIHIFCSLLSFSWSISVGWRSLAAASVDSWRLTILQQANRKLVLESKHPKWIHWYLWTIYIVYQFLWYNFIELYIYSSVVIKLIMHNCIIYISFNL